MKILLVHNYYQHSGGEDSVLIAERTLLEGHGHKVTLFAVNNDVIRGAVQKLKVAWDAPYSNTMRINLARLLHEINPDVIHIHNFFPLLTPSIYDACHEANIPVVQTLHNYRLICPGALLLRAGKVCEECLVYSPYRSALYGCYRGSRLGTLFVARMVDIHKKLGTWHTKVDRFIALTEFSRSKFTAAGFPSDRIVVKPNFAQLHDVPYVSVKRIGALFVGRLSSEKGITTLFEAWIDMKQVLRIIGNGPLDVQNNAHINFMGRRTSSDVQEAMSSSQLLVMPSLCYEGFPMVIVEAFACGLPVIASRLGAMAEIIEDGVTGLLFTPGDSIDLAAKVHWAFDHPEEMCQMGLNARKIYEQKYTPEENYRQLMAIYEAVISERRNRVRKNP